MPSTELVTKTATRRKSAEVEAESPPAADVDTAEVIASTDVLLDEIDRILDQNAIETLRGTLAGLDDVKPYTLADAIREGSSVTDQAIGAWTTPQGETCALSAAMLAIRARGLA